MIEQLQEGLYQLLIAVILGLITVAGAYATLYFKKLNLKIQAEIMNMEDEGARKLTLNALHNLDDLVTKTVMSIEQTSASTLRDAIKILSVHGKYDKRVKDLDKEELQNQMNHLAEDAFNMIKSTLAKDTLGILELTFEDLDSYIKKSIESKVYEIKQQKLKE
jgi:uncharacterized membrane protein YqhA